MCTNLLAKEIIQYHVKKHCAFIYCRIICLRDRSNYLSISVYYNHCLSIVSCDNLIIDLIINNQFRIS